MTQETMDNAALPAELDEAATLSESASAEDKAETPAEVEIVYCATCGIEAGRTCHRCATNLCDAHTYREENGTLDYCRACADALVGVCAVCDALHTKPCRECGMKVCEAHQKRVIERWGWGGMPGQGSVLDWFPMIRTYCQEHGRQRFDLPKPVQRALSGHDGSSPEW